MIIDDVKYVSTSSTNIFNIEERTKIIVKGIAPLKLSLFFLHNIYKFYL